MGEALALFGVSVASALIPLINIEVYLIGLAAVRDSTGIWLLATIAGVGQMVGKVVWYYLGANALKWPWIAKRIDTPEGQGHAREVAAAAPTTGPCWGPRCSSPAR